MYSWPSSLMLLLLSCKMVLKRSGWEKLFIPGVEARSYYIFQFLERIKANGSSSAAPTYLERICISYSPNATFELFL
ncbi:hypothetical protein PRUPE_7G017100 [Prunus persica]|uniref:Secreted protein n=1 Tax=Prunus persica TaxID=3760 RepID=A0A251N566_PRUPE|nr:hypothetical protein PRUPE_7G017100 [Prunus persica]